MDTTHPHCEALDRLILLLASSPRKGWEHIYEEVAHREVERLAPHSAANEGNKKGAVPPKEKAPDPGKGSTNGSIPE